MMRGLSRDDGSDRYAGEVVRVAQTRVIICRDGLQWILQRCGPGQAQRRWLDQGYFTTRTPLEALWRSAVGAVPNQISDLPAHFPRKITGDRHD